ncbi:hypothetical protein Plhal304r1_c031g0101781 [Plasmopara halstedii]
MAENSSQAGNTKRSIANAIEVESVDDIMVQLVLKTQETRFLFFNVDAGCYSPSRQVSTGAVTHAYRNSSAGLSNSSQNRAGVPS